MRYCNFLKTALVILIFISNAIYAGNPPVITASSNPNPYCPRTYTKIVNTATLSDPENVVYEIYIQISTGYINGQDQLKLNNPSQHPTIGIYPFDPTTGKLRLSGIGTSTTLADFEAAIEDVEFYNSSASPSGIRKFSISIGNANYLPSTQHYYEFIPNTAITWADAKVAAESKNYYGLQGYLATVTSMEEVQITGEQATGSGWIGGSDEAVDDVWRWMTGPEKGTVFWNGKANGSSPNFSYWNTNEPNDYASSGEKYAHITARGVGIKGSWNDMTNTGDNSGATVNGVVAAYQAKGYAIEYGGMPGDPPLQISASTSLTIPKITGTTPNSRCGSGEIELKASVSNGTINWYSSTTSSTSLGAGESYSPSITETTTFYVEAGCAPRTPIVATVNTIPDAPIVETPESICSSESVTLEASAIGIINWYSTPTGGTSIATGNNFPTPPLSQDTSYYAEANNNGCISTNRTPVTITVYKLPDVTDETVVLCKSSSVTLDAEVSGMSYLWSSGGGTNQTFTVSATGEYTVTVTSPEPEKCSSTKKITVIEHNVPEIDRIDVNETTVVIYLKQEEDYFEFSVDGINYQSSNVFFNVQSGLQTAYVREINQCSWDNKTFIVLIIPQFFTPNNDTYNDLWEVKGLINYPEAQLSIFDRYGKFLTELNASKLSWDGTLNKKPLPADDYWYVLKIEENKPEMRGHFSLKR